MQALHVLPPAPNGPFKIAFQRLEQAGHITRKPSVGGRGHTTTYLIHPLDANGQEIECRWSDKKGAADAPFQEPEKVAGGDTKGAAAAPLEIVKGASGDIKGASDDIKGAAAAPEHIKNKKGRKNKGASSKFIQPSLEQLEQFATDSGLPKSDGTFFFHRLEGNGWRNGNAAIKSWESTFRAWLHAGWLPSQKTGSNAH